jgi:hypothetical protein
MNFTKEQFGEFSRQLALYVVAQNYDKPVALLENFNCKAEKLSSIGCCVICARGRNIPLTESKNITFKNEDITKLKRIKEMYEDIVPIVAYVCVDEMEKLRKIRVFFAELDDVEEMTEDEIIGFLNQSDGGITLRYTEGKIVQWLSEIKKSTNKFHYVELCF